ncbi:aminotransferase family protein [Microscilla marina ATCC 23134]|uniref:Aminotransferase family protein n=2 Tax=Microscilla marina TaxID=1027 RepID=A1ZKF1_MICM2|nr:aminotransferase family protein [Microscilla marina ATCC 23134]
MSILGKIMKSKRIYLSPPDLKGQELEHLQAALQSNWIAPIGPHLDKFEELLSRYLDDLPVVALNSGTAAIHLALRLLGVTEKDEVICPTFTFVATTNPVMYQKATPVLIDSELDTWNMCPVQLERAIEDRLKQGKPKPKAIIIVHLYGQPAQLTQLLAIAQKYEIPVIEDAAEALGSCYNGQKAGTWGHLGVISFNGNKIVTTSAGGALVTRHVSEAKKALFWATQSKDKAPYYQHSEVGYNYRLSNLLAAIGVGQMQQLEEKVAHRRRVFDYYQQNLPADVLSFQPELSGTFSNRWLTCIVLNQQKTSVTPLQLQKALEVENIESRPLWKPMHLQPLLRQCPYYGHTVAEGLFQQGLCLPSGASLQVADLDRIVQVIKRVLSV